MSYSNLILNDNSDIENISLSALNTTAGPSVQVKWNGSGIHTITGPVPLVEITNSVNNGSNDLPESIVTSIRIQGKIVRHDNIADNANLNPNYGGISGILGAIDKLKQEFSKCPYGTLAIDCNGTSMFAASGAVLKDINFSQTNDNWTKTADYDISLESTVPISGTSSPDYFVTNKTDRWSVEQIEDGFYSDFAKNISHQNPEYSNPQLGASFTTTVPPQNVGGGNTTASSLRVLSLPQFRVSHTVSARGIPPTTGNNCASISELNKLCLLNAKAWVNKQLDRSAQSSESDTNSRSPYIAHLPSSTFFFNHIRSVNIDLSTYEVTDSFLAMPTGIPYTETYTLETSTSEDFVKTVRVVGNIVGLRPISGNTVSSSGLDLDSGSPIDLSAALSVPDTIVSSFTRSDDSASSASPGVKSNKYDNAISGWVYDIKPHLYRRACLAMNTPDRTLQYTNPAFLNRPPENPIYSRERPLSTIPASITEGHDPRKGTISYSVEYKNNLKIISGVLSENIDISYDVPHDEVATITVPGRALGPILARTGRSATRKTLNISVVVVPPTSISGTVLNSTECPLYTGGNVYRTILDIINGNKPFTGSPLITSRNSNGIVFTQTDNESWSPSQGRYSRNVQWIYQACDITKTYMEH
jgi:hypothetical protein